MFIGHVKANKKLTAITPTQPGYGEFRMMQALTAGAHDEFEKGNFVMAMRCLEMVAHCHQKFIDKTGNAYPRLPE